MEHKFKRLTILGSESNICAICEHTLQYHIDHYEPEDEFTKRQEEIEEQECTDYFKENPEPTVSITKAITVAIDTIYKLNGLLPPSKKLDCPMDWVGNDHGFEIEAALWRFSDK